MNKNDETPSYTFPDPTRDPDPEVFRKARNEESSNFGNWRRGSATTIRVARDVDFPKIRAHLTERGVSSRDVNAFLAGSTALKINGVTFRYDENAPAEERGGRTFAGPGIVAGQPTWMHEWWLAMGPCGWRTYNVQNWDIPSDPEECVRSADLVHAWFRYESNGCQGAPPEHSYW